MTLEKGKFWIKKSKVIDLEKSSIFLEIFLPSKQINLPYNSEKEKEMLFFPCKRVVF